MISACWQSATPRPQALFYGRRERRVRQFDPLTILTDKAHSYAEVIGEINDRRGPDGAIRHVDRKYLNNRIESDHTALKQRLRPLRGFQTLASAKVALAGIKTFRAIRKGHFENCAVGVASEIDFVAKLFPKAA